MKAPLFLVLCFISTATAQLRSQAHDSNTEGLEARKLQRFEAPNPDVPHDTGEVIVNRDHETDAEKADIDYHSAGALTLFIVLLVLFWSCCCGWQLECGWQRYFNCNKADLSSWIIEKMNDNTLKYYVLLIIAAWVSAGTLFFYLHDNGWPLSQAFYYTCQVYSDTTC